MFCPICGDEYREGFERCVTCGADLVREPPAADEPDTGLLTIVTVLAAGDDTYIAMARSQLDAAEIGYWIKGHGLQDLFGMGRLGAGYNVVIGPILLQVEGADVEEAIAVLAGIGPASGEEDESLDGSL